MSEDTDRIIKVPGFVLRDMWIEGSITDEQYNGEITRRQDKQASLVADLERCKLVLDIIAEKTKDPFLEPATRHNVQARLKTIRDLAEGALKF